MQGEWSGWSRTPTRSVTGSSHPTPAASLASSAKPGVSGHLDVRQGSTPPSVSASQLSKLRDIAAQLEEDGSLRFSAWVSWAAAEIDSLRLQLLAQSSYRTVLSHEDTLTCQCGHQARYHAEDVGDDHCLDCESLGVEDPCPAFFYDADRHQEAQS